MNKPIRIDSLKIAETPLNVVDNNLHMTTFVLKKPVNGVHVEDAPMIEINIKVPSFMLRKNQIQAFANNLFEISFGLME